MSECGMSKAWVHYFLEVSSFMLPFFTHAEACHVAPSLPEQPCCHARAPWAYLCLQGLHQGTGVVDPGDGGKGGVRVVQQQRHLQSGQGGGDAFGVDICSTGNSSTSTPQQQQQLL